MSCFDRDLLKTAIIVEEMDVVFLSMLMICIAMMKTTMLNATMMVVLAARKIHKKDGITGALFVNAKKAASARTLGQLRSVRNRRRNATRKMLKRIA